MTLDLFEQVVGFVAFAGAMLLFAAMAAAGAYVESGGPRRR